MTGLVDLIYPAGIFALDRIVRIGPREKTERYGRQMEDRKIFLADGTSRSVGEHFVDTLMHRPVQLLAAQPETFALYAWSDEDERDVTKSPVIAWALCLDGDVRPVTAQGVNDGDMMQDGEGYVLMPGGTVQSVGEHVEPVCFDTVDEYCAHMWEKQAARRAEQASAAATRSDGEPA